MTIANKHRGNWIFTIKLSWRTSSESFTPGSWVTQVTPERQPFVTCLSLPLGAKLSQHLSMWTLKSLVVQLSLVIGNFHTTFIANYHGKMQRQKWPWRQSRRDALVAPRQINSCISMMAQLITRATMFTNRRSTTQKTLLTDDECWRFTAPVDGKTRESVVYFAVNFAETSCDWGAKMREFVCLRRWRLRRPASNYALRLVDYSRTAGAQLFAAMHAPFVYFSIDITHTHTPTQHNLRHAGNVSAQNLRVTDSICIALSRFFPCVRIGRASLSLFLAAGSVPLLRTYTDIHTYTKAPPKTI